MLTGDFSKLARLADDSAVLWAMVPEDAAKEAAESIELLIQEEFGTGTDPYGRAWEPLKRSRKRDWVSSLPSHTPLTKTGALRSSISVKASGNSIDVQMGEPYGYYHQTGTSRMPARPILPNEPALPATWQSAIAEACEHATNNRVGGL